MTAYGLVTYLNDEVVSPTSGFEQAACHVYRGLARPAAHTAFQENVYVKLCNLDIVPRAITNEILAVRLGRLLGVPVANGYLAACPVRLLPARPAYLNSVRSSESCKVYASQSVSTSLRRSDQHRLVSIHSGLNRWHRLVEAALFDELLGNWDRNATNLVMSAPDEFVLIDHEYAFHGTDWGIESLASDISKPSRSNGLIAHIVSDGTEFVMARLRRCADEWARSVRLSVDLIPVTMRDGCGLTDEECGMLIDYLNQRARRLPELVDWQSRRPDVAVRGS